MLTVDSCPEGECWDGDVGLITKLIPKVNFDPKQTVAIIVGPPVMYRFCIQLLLDLGVDPDDIVVSLERRMKCGVGKCGHCQINNLYVCKDGPVFRYKDIMDLPEAFS
jgi:NAD(P)H-flavin reductase